MITYHHHHHHHHHHHCHQTFQPLHHFPYQPPPNHCHLTSHYLFANRLIIEIIFSSVLLLPIVIHPCGRVDLGVNRALARVGAVIRAGPFHIIRFTSKMHLPILITLLLILLCMVLIMWSSGPGCKQRDVGAVIRAGPCLAERRPTPTHLVTVLQ